MIAGWCGTWQLSSDAHGLAVDVSGASAWRKKGKNLGDHDFKWYGDKDPMHFTYNGEGGIDNRRENLRAFQKLWNANNKDKKWDSKKRTWVLAEPGEENQEGVVTQLLGDEGEACTSLGMTSPCPDGKYGAYEISGAGELKKLKDEL